MPAMRKLRQIGERLCDESVHPRVAGPLSLLVLLGLYAALRHAISALWCLDEADYFSPVLFPQLFMKPWGGVLLAAITIALALHWRTLRWSSFARGLRLRVILTCAVAILAWTYSLYPYNHYYGQGHVFDRCLVVLLAAASLLHPAMLVAFLAATTVVVHQVDFPFGLHSYTDKQLIFDVLSMFIAFLLMRTVVPRLPERLFLFALLCMVGAAYFQPGLGKLRVGWIFDEQLVRLFWSAHDNGWLHSLSEEGAQRFAAIVELLNMPLLIGTLIIELGAILLMTRRWVCLALVSGAVLMHIGIFATSGILFWKWILLDLVLIYCVARLSDEEARALFARRMLPLAIVAIGLGFVVFRSKNLGWLDAPLSHVYRIEAVATTGEVAEVTPGDLTPYDFSVTQGRFFFLSKDPFLVNTYGSTRRRDVLRALVACEDAAAVRATMTEMGKVRYSEEKIEQVSRFYRKYFQSLNRTDGRTPTIPSPPLHKWTGPVTELPRFDPRTDTARVRIRRVVSWLQNGAYLEIDNRIVLEVAIP